jgi:hypothetical protein
MSTGADDTPTAPGQPNIGALVTAAGGVFTLIAGVSLTGPVGRVVRNDGVPLEWALAAILLGAAFLAAAGLSTTGKVLEVAFSLLGLQLVVAGFIIAGVLAVRSGEHRERASITAALDDTLRNLKGKISLGTLPSDSRVVAIVESVIENANGDVVGTPQRLWRSYVGPDPDGKVDLDFVARLPAGRYDAVRIAAWSFDAEGANSDHVCTVRQEPAPDDTRSDMACVVLPLPPVPTAPTLEAQWTNTKADELSIHVAASNVGSSLPAAEASGARVTVVVTGQVTRYRDRRFYRAILRPDLDGALDTKFKVPVAPGPRRICVGAMYLAKGKTPRVSCRAVFNASGVEQAVVQLTRPAPTPADP